MLLLLWLLLYLEGGGVCGPRGLLNPGDTGLINARLIDPTFSGGCIATLVDSWHCSDLVHI